MFRKLSDASVALTLFILILLSSSAVSYADIRATGNNDFVLIDAGRDIVVVNGVVQALPVGAEVRVLGLGGNDRVLYRSDSGELERVRIVGSSLIVEFGGRRILAIGFERLEAEGDVNDTMIMEDSVDDDHLTITNVQTRLETTGRILKASGFARIEVKADKGGTDTVNVAAPDLDRLVSRPGEVVLSSTADPAGIARNLLYGFARIETGFVRQFSLFDTEVDEHLVLARKRLVWTSPAFVIEHIGDYEKVVANSDRFGRSGDDSVTFRMQKEGQTSVTLKDVQNPLRDLVLKYKSPAKTISIVNFEAMNVDMLPGVEEGETHLYLPGMTANTSLTAWAETESTNLWISAPFYCRLFSSGFNWVQYRGGPATWYGTDGPDEVTSTSVFDGDYLEYDEYTLTSGDFAVNHRAGENPLAISGNRLTCYAGEGNDRALFLEEDGGRVTVESEVVLRNGFYGFGFNDTATINLSDPGSSAFVETSNSTGPVKVVASPTSVAYSGLEFSHKVYGFPHVGVGFHRFSTSSNVRNYSSGEVTAIYNARDTGPLEFIKNGQVRYQTVSPYDKFSTLTATVAGNLYRTPESEVIFYGRSYTFDTYVYEILDGPTVAGLETMRLINQPADFTQTCQDPLEVPEY